jgi:hypothetical protein
MFAPIASTNNDDLLDLISVCTLLDHHIRMYQYHSNCTPQRNCFDLAAIPCLVFEPELLSAFESIEAILGASFEEEPLEVYFWERSTVHSPWNTYWSEAAQEAGGLDINDPVFGLHWTRYTGAHSWFPCDSEELSHCDENICAGILSTSGHAAAMVTTAKSLGIPLIVVTAPPRPLPKLKRIIGTGRCIAFVARSDRTEP